MLHSDPKKVAKAIMPAGFIQQQKWSNSGSVPVNKFSWRKSHGHAGGTMITKAIERAMALGFVPGKWNSTGNPDGSVMGNKSTYHHPDGWELTAYSSYGVVAYDNSFSLDLVKVEMATA